MADSVDPRELQTLRPGLARVRGCTLDGLRAANVRVEADVAPDLPGFSLVGLPRAALRESRERVGAALRNAGFRWPSGRITVSLAPADLPKDGAALDLPIAAALLLASGQIPRPRPDRLRRLLLVGELALDGALRPTRGVAPAVLDAPELGAGELILPAAHDRALAALRPEVPIRTVAHLRALPAALLRVTPPPRVQALGPEVGGAPRAREGGLEAVRGQRRALRAVGLAAAGGHHLLLVGPPGCGKTLLARRLVRLLPDLDLSSRRERWRIVNALQAGAEVEALARPPLRAPHPSISAAGLLGGGRPVRPGEVTLAHRGVLLLDEVGEFRRDLLDRLREPLTEGSIAIGRAGQHPRLPASFQLVAAGNPCPCGWHGSRSDRCRCTPVQVERVRRRLSGPLRDRIDLVVEMDREPAELYFESARSADLEWIEAIRRVRGRGGRGLRARLEGEALRKACALDEEGRRLCAAWADRRAWSLRGLEAVLRVARTIADLEGARTVGVEHLAEAFTYRPADGGARD